MVRRSEIAFFSHCWDLPPDQVRWLKLHTRKEEYADGETNITVGLEDQRLRLNILVETQTGTSGLTQTRRWPLLKSKQSS